MKSRSTQAYCVDAFWVMTNGHVIQCLPGGYLPSRSVPAQGVYLSRGSTCLGRGVPAWEGVYLPGKGCTCLGVYLPGVVYLPRGCTCLGVYLLGGVPAHRGISTPYLTRETRWFFVYIAIFFWDSLVMQHQLMLNFENNHL